MGRQIKDTKEYYDRKGREEQVEEDWKGILERKKEGGRGLRKRGSEGTWRQRGGSKKVRDLGSV